MKTKKPSKTEITLSLLHERIRKLESRFNILDSGRLPCSRCIDGAITTRDGSLDECPDCHGTRYKMILTGRPE